MATKPKGGGSKALVAGPLRTELFFTASLRDAVKYRIVCFILLKKNEFSLLAKQIIRFFFRKFKISVSNI